MKKHFYKTERNRMVSGVCAGIAEEFDIDISIIRVIWAICAFSLAGLILYILCAIIFPTE